MRRFSKKEAMALLREVDTPMHIWGVGRDGGEGGGVVS